MERRQDGRRGAGPRKQAGLPGLWTKACCPTVLMNLIKELRANDCFIYSGIFRFTNCLVFSGQGAMRQEALELRILLKRKFKLQLMTTVGLGRARICRRENSGSKLCSSGLATRTVAQRRRRLLLLLAQDWSPLFERVQQRHFPGLRLVTITVGQVSPGNSCGGAVLAMGGPSREASPLVQKVDRLHLWTSSILL